MGMVGLRDVLVVAPAASFHPHHHHHHHHHHDSSFLPSGGDQQQPMIPLLTTGPCLVDEHSRSSGIHLWQQNAQQALQHQQQQVSSQNPNPNPNLRKPMAMAAPVPMLDSAACTGIFNVGGSISAMGVASSSSSAMTCQDCGNQAKKDCTHRRCRTCCKSRGFDCSTHVKSTWVPAARRRERQQLSTGGAGAGGAAGSSASTSGSKKPRLLPSTSNTTASHTSTSNTTPPRSFDTSSSHQDAAYRENLPRHVRAPAVFKCVRVTSIDDGEDEYAYQAMVRIGGHVFKGFLYDQGVELADQREEDRNAEDDNDVHHAGASSSGIPNLSELHLGGGRSTGPSPSSAHMLVGADVYTGAGANFMAGGGGTAPYGNPMN